PHQSQGNGESDARTSTSRCRAPWLTGAGACETVEPRRTVIPPSCGRVAGAHCCAPPLRTVPAGFLAHRSSIFASSAGWLPPHRRRHRREVAPLARGAKRPLAAPLPSGLCFRPLALPATLSARLTSRFPHGEGYTLTTFCRHNRAGSVVPLLRWRV